MSGTPGGAGPDDTPLVTPPSTFCTGLRLWGVGKGEDQRGFGGLGEGGSERPSPLFLGEGLLAHGQVLLVLHEPQQRRPRLDAQPVVVVLGVPPAKREGQGDLGSPRAVRGSPPGGGVQAAMALCDLQGRCGGCGHCGISGRLLGAVLGAILEFLVL